MKAGRKRKVMPRTKTGQASRAGKDARMTVLGQPHRVGRLSEWRGTTVGRLLEDAGALVAGMSRMGLHEAAKRFCDAHEGWRGAVCSRRPLAVTTASTPGPEDEERTRRIVKRFEEANRELQKAGHPIRQAVFEVVCEHHEETWTPPFHMAFHCVEGLKILADHFGVDWRVEDKRSAA